MVQGQHCAGHKIQLPLDKGATWCDVVSAGQADRDPGSSPALWELERVFVTLPDSASLLWKEGFAWMAVKVTPNQREAITGLWSPFVGLFPSPSGRKRMNLKDSGLPVLRAGGVRQSRRRRLLPTLRWLPISDPRAGSLGQGWAVSQASTWFFCPELLGKDSRKVATLSKVHTEGCTGMCQLGKRTVWCALGTGKACSRPGLCRETWKQADVAEPTRQAGLSVLLSHLKLTCIGPKKRLLNFREFWEPIFFFFIVVIIYFLLLGLHCFAWAFSTCAAGTSRCSGVSCCGARAYGLSSSSVPAQ